MEETQKFVEKVKAAHPHIHILLDEEPKAKPEMIRRNRLVKWVRARSETYQMMMKTKPDPMYMEGMAYILNKLCDDFDIDSIDLQE